MKLAAKKNADRSVICRQNFKGGCCQDINICKETRCTEFRPELERRQEMECGKDNGGNTHFEPHAPASRNFILSRIFGVSSSRRLTREAGTPK